MATESPFFTVIIPTYARPARLKACLQAFTRLAYPRDRFELMVVDDGSPASMEPVVIPFAHALNVRLIRQENAGPAAARNAGAAHAQGSFLAFTHAPGRFSSTQSRRLNWPVGTRNDSFSFPCLTCSSW